MSDEYCNSCGSWLADPMDDDSYVDDQSEMSWDDWDYNAEEMADMEDPHFRSELKRSRAEANLDDYDGRPRKKPCYGVIGDQMLVD